MLIPLLFTLAAQNPADRAVLEAEHAREAGIAALVQATKAGGPRTRALAARGIGRLENPAYADVIAPLLSAREPLVRQAAAGALAQMKASRDWAPLLASERDGWVRSVMYEAAGRGAPPAANTEALLVQGLADHSIVARTGAARGLESLFRINRRTRKPEPATVAALRSAFAATTTAEFRQIALLVLLAADDRDPTTLAAGLADTSAQVRRLAVRGAERFVRDTSPLVRAEAYQYEADCTALAAGLDDRSDHVATSVIGYLQKRKCASALLVRAATQGANWRRRAHALVSLAAVDGEAARPLIPVAARDATWQVRMYAAEAARAVQDTVTLALLAKDSMPNVAAAAIRTPDEAMAALRSPHAGLMLAAAARLAQASDLPQRAHRIAGTFTRLTNEGSMTMRDPRVAMLELLTQVPDTATNPMLRDALYDRDPSVARHAAQILAKRTGTTMEPGTKGLPIPPIPPASYIAGLQGATVRITMRGLGTMTLALLPDEAPVTVGVFAQTAESRQYDGLTFHRIVTNFVVQGGSPGADEYDGRTREFMRDELGFARNARGTLGISTRGRDTGDGQIYFNLVDNVRLDRDYTVFARMLSGFDIMDRISEGDVMERVEILRAARR